MGLGDWISGAFGSKQEKQDVPQAAYGQDQANADKQRLQGLGQTLGGRGYIQGDATQAQGDYGQQQKALGLMQQAAEGNAPSQAQIQMQQGTDAALKATLAGAASTRGGALQQSLAGLNAQQQGAQAQQANVGASAALRAQEMAQARSAYGQQATQMRGQSMDWAQQQAQLALGSRSANDQAQLGAEGLANQAQGMAVQGDIAHMNAQQQANSQNAQQNQSNAAGLLGAVGSAAKAYFTTSDARAKAGIRRLDQEDGVPRMAPGISYHISGPGSVHHHYAKPLTLDEAMRGYALTSAAHQAARRPTTPQDDAERRAFDVERYNMMPNDLETAQQLTDQASAGRRGPPATGSYADEGRFNQGMDDEYREMMRTPGAGRYNTAPSPDDLLRMHEEDDDRRRLAEELAARQREETDKRIGSPRIISSEDAKMDIAPAGGSPDAEAGTDSGSGSIGGALGAGFETFGQIASKPGKGAGAAIPSLGDLGVAGSPKVAKAKEPFGGTSHRLVQSDPNDPGSALVAAPEDPLLKSDKNVKRHVERVAAGPVSAPRSHALADALLGPKMLAVDKWLSAGETAPAAAGSGREATEAVSDRNAKQGVFRSPMVAFMEGIHPDSYEYKDRRDDPMGQQGAKRVGIIAQEAASTPVGRTMIQRTPAPDGHNRLAINIPAGLSVALASIAALQEEVDVLKGKRARHG